MCKRFFELVVDRGKQANVDRLFDAKNRNTVPGCAQPSHILTCKKQKNIHQNECLSFCPNSANQMMICCLGRDRLIPFARCIEVPCNSATEISLVVAIPCGSVGTSWSRIRHPKLPGFGV